MCGKEKNDKKYLTIIFVIISVVAVIGLFVFLFLRNFVFVDYTPVQHNTIVNVNDMEISLSSHSFVEDGDEYDYSFTFLVSKGNDMTITESDFTMKNEYQIFNVNKEKTLLKNTSDIFTKTYNEIETITIIISVSKEEIVEMFKKNVRYYTVYVKNTEMYTIQINYNAFNI